MHPGMRAHGCCSPFFSAAKERQELVRHSGGALIMMAQRPHRIHLCLQLSSEDGIGILRSSLQPEGAPTAAVLLDRHGPRKLVASAHAPDMAHRTTGRPLKACQGCMHPAGTHQHPPAAAPGRRRWRGGRPAWLAWHARRRLAPFRSPRTWESGSLVIAGRGRL